MLSKCASFSCPSSVPKRGEKTQKHTLYPFTNIPITLSPPEIKQYKSQAVLDQRANIFSATQSARQPHGHGVVLASVRQWQLREYWTASMVRIRRNIFILHTYRNNTINYSRHGAAAIWEQGLGLERLKSDLTSFLSSSLISPFSVL